MQVTLPENLFRRLTELALRQQQSVENLLVERLSSILDDELSQLPTTEQAELQALHYLSDEVLLLIAAEQMQSKDQVLLTELMERNSAGILSPQDRDTLTSLVEQGDKLMLRKAEAAAILVSRGYVKSAGTFVKSNV